MGVSATLVVGGATVGSATCVPSHPVAVVRATSALSERDRVRIGDRTLLVRIMLAPLAEAIEQDHRQANTPGQRRFCIPRPPGVRLQRDGVQPYSRPLTITKPGTS